MIILILLFAKTLFSLMIEQHTLRLARTPRTHASRFHIHGKKAPTGHKPLRNAKYYVFLGRAIIIYHF